MRFQSGPDVNGVVTIRTRQRDKRKSDERPSSAASAVAISAALDSPFSPVLQSDEPVACERTRSTSYA